MLKRENKEKDVLENVSTVVGTNGALQGLLTKKYKENIPQAELDNYSEKIRKLFQIFAQVDKQVNAKMATKESHD